MKKNCKAEVWFSLYECVFAPLSPSREQRADGRGVKREAEGQYLPASAWFALFLSERISGLQWDHHSMSLLLEGTPCCYALITHALTHTHTLTNTTSQLRGERGEELSLWTARIQMWKCSPLTPTASFSNSQITKCTPKGKESKQKVSCYFLFSFGTKCCLQEKQLLHQQWLKFLSHMKTMS